MKRFIYIFLSFFLFLGCDKTPKEQKTLKISFKIDPPTLDARKSGYPESSVALYLLFSGLTELTKDGIQPSLAKSYEISKDKKTYTFHLRDNIRWSDGEKITAYDFEYSWKKIADPKFPSLCPHLLYPIENAEEIIKKEMDVDKLGIKAVDEKTFVVKLKNPIPYFLSLTSYCVFFPVAKHIDEKYPNWESDEKHFVSSGPFALKRWHKSNKIILKKNGLYWNKNNIRLNKIHISIVDNENTCLQMFENGELDWAGAAISPLPIDSIPAILKKKEHKITPIGGTTFCAFNTEKVPFNNKNIRKAFSLAIDRKSIVENITQARELVATKLLPPILMNNKNIDLIEDNNISQAKELFEMGLKELDVKKEDLNITLSCGSVIFFKKQAEALQEQWQKTFGIPVKLEQVEEKVMYYRLHKHSFQMAMCYWLAQYNDPMNIFERFKYKTHSKNYTNWESKKYISLLNSVDKISDGKKRMELLKKAEKILSKEVPFTTIHHHNYITLTKPNVEGIFIGPVGELHFEKTYKK